MSKIVLDAALIEKLRQSMQTVEVCDPLGNVVGLFTPKIDPAEYAIEGPEISDEELARRINSSGPRYPGSEVLRRLRDQ